MKVHVALRALKEDLIQLWGAGEIPSENNNCAELGRCVGIMQHDGCSRALLSSAHQG